MIKITCDMYVALLLAYTVLLHFKPSYTYKIGCLFFFTYTFDGLVYISDVSVL